jgi:hypothetical protein
MVRRQPLRSPISGAQDEEFDVNKRHRMERSGVEFRG